MPDSDPAASVSERPQKSTTLSPATWGDQPSTTTCRQPVRRATLRSPPWKRPAHGPDDTAQEAAYPRYADPSRTPDYSTGTQPSATPTVKPQDDGGNADPPRHMPPKADNQAWEPTPLTL